MIQILELVFNIIVAIAVSVVAWAIWPVLTALVAVLNAIAHFFVH